METVDEKTGEVLVTDAELVVVVEKSPDVGGVTESFVRVETCLRDGKLLETILPDVHTVEATAKAVYRFWKSCEAAIVARMVERNASLVGNPKTGPALALKQEHEYTYDEAGLKKLLDLVGRPDGLTEAEYESAMGYKFSPSKSVLNTLAKRGGKVAEIINLGVRGTTRPKLELKGGGRK